VAENYSENRNNFVFQPNSLLLQIELQSKFDLNIKPTTNVVFWWNFWIFFTFSFIA